MLLLGFVVFLILAPAIVLYVRGITYDFSKKTFVTTGILAIRSEPKDAGIYLNNKLRKASSGDIKFVVPGEYEVSVKKDGYFTWSKRLIIESGQVAWGSPAFNKIFLLLKNPPAKTFATKVSDAYSQGDDVIYVTDDALNFISFSDSINPKKIFLPEKVDSIVTADAGLDNIILSASGTKLTLFNKSSEHFFDLSNLFKENPEFIFNGSDLFALYENSLYSVDKNTQTKTLLFPDITAFNFQDGLLYFVKSEAKQKPKLYTSQAPFSTSHVLMENLPDFASGKLFITYEKQIFLLANGNLYLINSTMDKLADNVSYSNFQKNDSTLAIIHLGQADYYDPLARNLNYITRTSENLKNLVAKNNIGQAFFISNGKINSIELDTRDRQNQYQLYDGLVEKFFVDGSAKNIILLDSGILKSMVIR